MIRTVPAIFENGVFRPTQPVDGLPEHAAVRLTIEASAVDRASAPNRALGLQQNQIISIAADFDAELDDDIWFGVKP